MLNLVLPLLSQAVILAGFKSEESAMIRGALDLANAVQIKVLPCTQDMLHMPLVRALEEEELDWSLSRPKNLPQGREWGSQRAVLISGMRWACSHVCFAEGGFKCILQTWSCCSDGRIWQLQKLLEGSHTMDRVHPLSVCSKTGFGPHTFSPCAGACNRSCVCSLVLL